MVQGARLAYALGSARGCWLMTSWSRTIQEYPVVSTASYPTAPDRFGTHFTGQRGLRWEFRRPSLASCFTHFPHL